MSKELANLMSRVEKYRGKHVVAVEDEIAVSYTHLTLPTNREV